MAGAVWFFWPKKVVPVKNNGEFIGYNLGTEITFKDGGNSFSFVKTNEGWSHQEPDYRCTFGDFSLIKLYIPEVDEGDLRLTLSAFGVYDPEDKYQKVDVWANDTKVAEWQVTGLDSYVAVIPARLIKDGKLTLRFDIDKPYIPPVDVRRLGMAVFEIKIERIYAAEVKRKIGKKLKQFLNPTGDASLFDEKTTETDKKEDEKTKQ